MSRKMTTTLVEVNKANFSSITSTNGVVILDLWSERCGACKQFAPVFRKIADRYPKHTFGMLDAEKEEDLISELGIEYIPTLMLYRDGILLFNQPGYLEEAALEDILAQAEALDMEVVRAETEARAKRQADGEEAKADSHPSP